MISKIILHQDGSLEFPEGKPEDLKLYTHSPSGPNTFSPRFELCVYRENKCKLSPCGKRPIFRWDCSLLMKQVGVKDCDACNQRRETPL